MKAWAIALLASLVFSFAPLHTGAPETSAKKGSGICALDVCGTSGQGLPIMADSAISVEWPSGLTFPGLHGRLLVPDSPSHASVPPSTQEHPPAV